MIALIMAGGIGSRFWPLSRKSNPKQYLNIFSDKSMIRLTAERLLPLIDWKDIYVVTSDDQKELVSTHLPEMPVENIIIEPFGRNTAPCIGLSALYLAGKYPSDEVMTVLPADHFIRDEEAFLNSLKLAEVAAKQENLVTFGIEPEYPATGYGYIEKGETWRENMFHVKQFKEKPDHDTAVEFLESGNYLWNSGMFAWRIDTIREHFQRLLPRLEELLIQIQSRWSKSQSGISDIYETMPKIPVDIGIMEQAHKRIVIPVSYGWSDVGSWRALYDLLKKDDDGNVESGEVISLNTKNCYVRSKRLIATIDLENLVIVETDDTILISKKDSAEKVKEIQQLLEKRGTSKYL